MPLGRDIDVMEVATGDERKPSSLGFRPENVRSDATSVTQPSVELTLSPELWLDAA